MDYIEAYEEIADMSTLYLFKLCGSLDSNLPNEWRSVSNQVIVHFHSDGSIFGKGFKLTFTEVSGRIQL